MILDDLKKNGEPVLLTRGTKVEAALVPIELFRARFLDTIAEDELDTLRQRVRARRARPVGDESTLATLRRLRGYKE